MRNFILAYSTENNVVAQEMDQNLSRAGFNFHHINAGNSNEDHSLSSQINQNASSDPVLLFVSDNFLRSASCMYKALLLIKNLNDSNRLFVVITDGIQKDPLTKQVSATHTSFDRVSHVIQYMNFWQEQYLAMRKQKRGMSEEESVGFEEKLKVVRTISTEIGEFLRLLRSTDYVQYEELKQNNFELFFNATGNTGLYLDYKKVILEAKSNTEDSSTPEVAPEPEANNEIPPQTIEPSITEEVIDNVADSQEAPLVPTNKEELEKTLNPDQLKVSPSPLTEEVAAPSIDNQAESDDYPDEEDLEEIDLEDIPMEEVNPPAPQGLKVVHSNKINEEKVEPEELIIEENNKQKEEPTISIESQDELAVEDPALNESRELLESLFDEDEDDSLNTEESSSQDKIEQNNKILQHAALLFENKQIHEGLVFIREKILEDPKNCDLRFHYAEALLIHKEDHEVAINQLEKLLKIEPEHIASHLLLAEVAEAMSDLDTSIHHYNSVYDIQPKIPGLAYKLGTLKVNSSNTDVKEHASLFKEALKLDPLNVDARYQYAVLLYEDLNKPNKAVRHFEETLRLAPAHPFANYDLALIYYQKGELKKASEYYNKAHKNNPELKTPENDLAFKYKGKVENPQVNPEVVETIATQKDFKVIEPKAEEEEKPVIPKKDTKALILITGATSGIGKATAELLAEKGFRLILTGRRAEKLTALKKQFEDKFKTECHTLAFDVRSAAQAKDALKTLPEAFRSVDILINNAGLAAGYGPIHEGNVDDWETMIDTNIKGLLYMIRAISPLMVERRSGHIINVCSTAGHEVYPNGNVYCATKYAVDALTKSIRLDLHKYNIRVSQVSPGHVEETEFASVRFKGDAEKSKIYEDFNPLKSKDVAEVIWFIATRPNYVNIQDVLMMGTQQAGNNHIDRSGRND